MRKIAVGSALVAVLLLTSCTAPDDGAKAHEACLKDAISQLPKSAEAVNTDKVETANMSDAMREVIGNPLPPDPEDPVMWSTTGDIWYRDGGNDKSTGVLCLTSMKDGNPTEPVEANLIEK